MAYYPDIQHGNFRNMSGIDHYIVQALRDGEWVTIKTFGGGFQWSQSREFVRALHAEQQRKQMGA